jgi:hypothetical protein
MREPQWPGIATAVAILWLVSNVVILGVAGPIWRAASGSSSDAWIGFAGNALGAGIALLAAIVAGIAAYRTVVPMQRQLSELVRQNNFAHYERLRQRAADLTDMTILIENVNASLEVMDRSFALSGIGAGDGRAIAFNRLEQCVVLLRNSRRLVWGDENAQSLTGYFIDNSLRATTTVRDSLPGPTNAGYNHAEWVAIKNIAFQGGVALHARIKWETDILASEIAALEPLVLNRQPFPQLWKGDYPGPEKMAEMYSPRPAGNVANTPTSGA